MLVAADRRNRPFLCLDLAEALVVVAVVVVVRTRRYVAVV
jgi:hypothetical protein